VEPIALVKWRRAVPRNRSCLTNDEMLGLIARSLGMELSEGKQRNCAFCGVRIADVQSVRDESYVYSASQGNLRSLQGAPHRRVCDERNRTSTLQGV